MSCLFCAIVRGELPASVFLETDELLGFLDIQPVRPGHALIVPRAHAVRVAELSPDTASELWAAGIRVGDAVREALGCDDVHLLVNDGPAASQTVPHVHLHVVPRAHGDFPRFLARVLSKPVPVGRPARAELDDHAAAIRAALEADAG